MLVGVKMHSTRVVSTSWALGWGATLPEVCVAATWSTPTTFTRFCCVNVATIASFGEAAGLKLCQVHIQGTTEGQGGSDGGHHLSSQPVQVGVGGTLDVQVPPADDIDGLIVHHEDAVRVLQGGVGGQNGVVGLQGSWVNSKLQLGLFAVVHREALHQQGGEARASASSKGVEDEETLEPCALISQFASPVENRINDFLADCVVTMGVVVG